MIDPMRMLATPRNLRRAASLSLRDVINTRAAGFSLRGVARLNHRSSALQDPRGLMPAAQTVRSVYPLYSRAFTLVEMVVVIVVILIIVGLVVPAAAALWNERKMSGAINIVKGLLMTSRAHALKAGGVETGFLAFVDDKGVQHFVSIEQPAERLDDPAWQHVFVIRGTRDQVLPAPMRVVPRYVVDDPDADQEGWATFSDAELDNNDFDNVEGNQAQRHRNYFTMVYSTDGHLLINRDVLIQDRDADQDTFGDRTGLAVGPGDPNDNVNDGTTENFYDIRTDAPTDFDPLNPGITIESLAVDGSATPVAINFSSVDGLLVYDDSLFKEVPQSEKRAVMLRTAQPLYVSRFTGATIRGPVGENETP